MSRFIFDGVPLLDNFFSIVGVCWFVEDWDLDFFRLSFGLAVASTTVKSVTLMCFLARLPIGY